MKIEKLKIMAKYARSGYKGSIKRSKRPKINDPFENRMVIEVFNSNTLMSSLPTRTEFNKSIIQGCINYIHVYGVTQSRDLYWNGDCILDIYNSYLIRQLEEI